MPPNPTDHKQGNRRKLLIYGGVAAAVLLVALLMRRSASSSAAGAAATTPPQPVSNPAVDPSSYYTGGTGAGGVDYGPQLANLDTDVQTLAGSIASWVNGQTNPGPNTPGVTGTVTPSTPSSVNVNVTVPSQPGPGNRPPVKPKTPTVKTNAQYLAPGAKSPGYALTPPKGAPSGARWAGPHPPGGWRGIGGGWYVRK